MYYAVYDRNFNILGNVNPLKSYKLQRRAYDKNALKIVGTKLADDIKDPFWVSINERTGEIIHMALCGVPYTNKDNQTEIEARDIKSIFDTKAVFDFAGYLSGTVSATLADFMTWIWETVSAQIDFGFDFQFDVSDVSGITLDLSLLPVDKTVYNVWEIMSTELYYYRCYLEVIAEPATDAPVKVAFAVKHIGKVDDDGNRNLVSVELSDFGISEIDKVINGVNKVVVYEDDTYTDTMPLIYYLYSDNTIGTNGVHASRIYPEKVEIFAGDNGLYNAIKMLAENMYNENINIPISESVAGKLLADVDFDTLVDVYSGGVFYRTLPIGEIETTHDGKKTIKVGYRAQEIVQNW